MSQSSYDISRANYDHRWGQAAKRVDELSCAFGQYIRFDPDRYNTREQLCGSVEDSK